MAMASMSNYCKAYPAAQLSAFPGWIASTPPASAVEEGSDGYYYLHDNYTVTAGVFVDEQVAFDDVSDEWKRFCVERLEFAVPEYTRERMTELDPSVQS
jgi:hypothetical protein